MVQASHWYVAYIATFLCLIVPYHCPLFKLISHWISESVLSWLSSVSIKGTVLLGRSLNLQNVPKGVTLRKSLREDPRGRSGREGGLGHKDSTFTLAEENNHRNENDSIIRII